MERTVLADQMKTFLNIGSAQIVEQSDTSEDSAARQSNFYAIAYDWDGETIISYRGTDDPLNDANTGYGLGGDGGMTAAVLLKTYTPPRSPPATDPHRLECA